MPKTPDGKLRSSQNSTEHGLRSDHFRLLPGESREEFETLRKSWLDRYQNHEYADSAILLMVEKLAENDWLVRRGMQAVCNAQQRFAEAELANQSEEVLEKTRTQAQRALAHFHVPIRERRSKGLRPV